MTERLADVSARIAGIRQLGAVVNAMRGIAAARAQQARGQLVAVDRYAGTIGDAIGQILASLESAPPPPVRRPGGGAALVLFCAEQGFAGAFSEHVLEAAGADLATSELFLIGTRGAAIAAERGVKPGWTSAMPSHSLGIPKLADHIAQALYARISAGAISRLDAMFSQRHPPYPIAIERRRLFPFDLAAFPHAKNATPPLTNLPPAELLGDLTADYMHAELCSAALHAFASENQARMEAMAAARNQIEQQLTTLQATQRRVRQEEITAEIIELAAGVAGQAERKPGAHPQAAPR